MGDLPAQPRRARPQPADRRAAQRRVRAPSRRSPTCGSTAAASAAGWRRCCSGDRRHIELAYALQFSLPGTPVLRYGEEIGMGENLALPGRDAIRTPMQWDDGRNGGFSTAPTRAELMRPVITRGRYGAGRSTSAPSSATRTRCCAGSRTSSTRCARRPEIGAGSCTVVDVPLPRSVLAHRFDAPDRVDPAAAQPGRHDGDRRHRPARRHGTAGPYDLLVDGRTTRRPRGSPACELHGWGYRWIRLRRRNQA